MVLHQLQAKLDELEKLFAAHRLRSPAPGSGIRLSKDVFEFDDANALLRMVDNLEHNMKQSMTESARGRQYERYMEKRDWGSQGPRARLEVKRMEESFGEIWAQTKEQLGGRDQNKHMPAGVRGHRMECREQEAVESYHSEVFSSEHVKYGHGTYMDKAAPNYGIENISERHLHRRSSSFTTVPSVARPSTREKSQYPLSQSGPIFSDLRKENMKPFTVISKVENPLSPRSFIRSKISAEGPKGFKEEKVTTPQHRRIRSSGSNELNSTISMKSDNPNPALSRFSKEMSEKNMPNESLNNGQSKPFLRRGTGIGPGAGVSIAKMRAIKASEFENKVEESEDSRNPPSRSELEGEDSRSRLESVASGNAELENDVILSSDKHVGIHSSYATSQFDTTLDNVEEPTEELQRTSNLSRCSLRSGLHDTDAGSPAIRKHAHPLCLMRQADDARVRKKWESDEKTLCAADSSEKPLKDVAKAFKKLLKFGRKNKIVESAAVDSMSTSTASEGFDDMDGHHDLANQPSDDLKKLRIGYPISSPVGSHEVEPIEGSILVSHANIKLRDDHQSRKSPKVPHSFFSFPTFRSNVK